MLEEMVIQLIKMSSGMVMWFMAQKKFFIFNPFTITAMHPEKSGFTQCSGYLQLPLTPQCCVEHWLIEPDDGASEFRGPVKHSAPNLVSVSSLACNSLAFTELSSLIILPRNCAACNSPVTLSLFIFH